MLRVAIARAPDAPADGHAPAPAWAGESERRRWASLPADARRHFAASRGLLRELLQHATGTAGGDWDVSAQAGTAPVVRSRRAREDDVLAPCASLSHRLGWVAAAIADAAVGIDIECDRPVRSDPCERAALMLAHAERAAWQALAPEPRASALLDRWAAKEAWFKASPPGTAPWDFRQVVARACEPAQANVRVWRCAPLHVAVSFHDAPSLAEVSCDGLDDALAQVSFWHVAPA